MHLASPFVLLASFILGAIYLHFLYLIFLSYFVYPSSAGRDGAFGPRQDRLAAAGREGHQLIVPATQGPGEGAGGAGDKRPGNRRAA